ncbi:hypothetical protein BJQ90_03642 [Arthrobacter sp. SO3]|nr:hypothetical protein [Arthrobacter sp. SO3]
MSAWVYTHVGVQTALRRDAWKHDCAITLLASNPNTLVRRVYENSGVTIEDGAHPELFPHIAHNHIEPYRV